MISFNSIVKQYGGTVLFDNVSASLNEQYRTGLIGNNGTGKTTLLRMLNNEEALDSGSITFPNGLSIGYLPQEVETFDGQTPIDIILKPYKHLLEYENTLTDLAHKIDTTNLQNQTLKAIEKLHAEMEFHDGFSLNARAEMILTGLGVPSDFWQRPIEQLSGGFRMRAVLGRLLLQSPDYLLLDEPTNHLDMDSLIWLEKFLLRYKGGMLIVSHDRDFLNRITTHTAQIANQTITVHKGNYDSFIAYSEEVQANAENRTKNLETQIAHMERFVERFKSKNTKATQAQSRIKQIEVLKAELPVLTTESKSIHFRIQCPKPSGSVPFKLENLCVSYGEHPVLTNVNISISRGEKVAIIGPNGAGKSTLLKTLTGLLTPSSGTIITGHNTIIRYFGQHQLEQLDPEKTLLETVASESVNTEKTYIRNTLGTFLFSGDSVDKKVSVLSGGEKSRLVLATILSSPGNTLLLDEPTNHLDIRSTEVLADALNEFEGTIVFVSHDEFFISKIADRIIEIRPGIVRDFPGSLEDYRTYLEMLFSGEQKDPNTKSKSGTTESSEKDQRIKDREKRKKIGRAIEKNEKQIETCEKAIADLQAILDNPQNGSHHELLHTTAIEIQKQQTTLETLMKEWEQLQIEFEEIESSSI